MSESIQIEYTPNYELISYKFIETIKEHKTLGGVYFLHENILSIHIPTYIKDLEKNGPYEPTSFDNLINSVIKQINRVNKINKLLNG